MPESLEFDYEIASAKIEDSGHAVVATVNEGGFLNVGGDRYDLLQFHFHTPSEHAIDGKVLDGVAHLIS